jgi:hypothetical protein
MAVEVLIDLLLFVGAFLAAHRRVRQATHGGASRKALDGVRVGVGPFRSAVVRDLPAPAAETPPSGRCAGDGASAPMLPARRVRVNGRRERRSAISTGHAALFAVAMVATAVAAVALAEVDDHG